MINVKTVFILINLLVITLVGYYVWNYVNPPNFCTMTYMWPAYEQIDMIEESVYANKYKLFYQYRDKNLVGGLVCDRETHVVLFNRN